MVREIPDVEGATDQASKRSTLPGIATNVQAFVRQVANARGESKAQQVHQPEHMIGESGGVGIVLFNPQIRLVVRREGE